MSFARERGKYSNRPLNIKHGKLRLKESDRLEPGFLRHITPLLSNKLVTKMKPIIL